MGFVTIVKVEISGEVPVKESYMFVMLKEAHDEIVYNIENELEVNTDHPTV